MLIACEGGGQSGAPVGSTGLINAPANAGSAQVNGPLIGDIWYEGGYQETHRHNLETGKTSKISNYKAYPTRDGTKYTELLPEVNYISPLQSPCSESFYVSRVSVRETRTGQVLSTFDTFDPISNPIKPSPDGSRLMAISNDDPCDLVGLDDSVKVSIYAASGELLMRLVKNVILFDWMFDGRAVVLRSDGGGKFSLLFESAPGTLDFQLALDWTFPEGTQGLGLRGLQSNHDGTKFLFEVVLDESRAVGINYRYSHVLMIDMNQGNVYSVFKGNEPDGTLKATEPVFSPDGNWILATQNYWAGAAVSISLPPSGVSYAVRADAKDQLLPPTETSDSVRPILMSTDSTTRQTIRLNPIGGQAWTPTVLKP